ncbi:MAG TPA: hypothetical protein VEW91_00395, partial [bacterium]|nr:hypothetical protein [bacterium]
VETPSEADEALALADAAPDPVVSAFTPSDAQVLNLLARAPVREAEAILTRSFAAFQRRPQIAPIRARLEALPPDPLTTRPCGDRVTTRGRFDHLLRRLRRERRRRPDTTRQAAGSPAAAPAAQVADVGRALLEMPCTGCPVVQQCLATLKDLRAVERRRYALAAELSDLEDHEIRVFRRRAAILRDLGYLDSGGRLTPQGRIAARIRHPRMLILAEALRSRILPADPVALAAVSGALGTERVGPPTRRGDVHHRGRDLRHPGARTLPDLAIGATGAALDQASWHEARKALLALRSIVAGLNKRRAAAGLPQDPVEREFDPVGGGPAPTFRRAAVVGAWASGRPWEEVVTRHRIPEGDLQRLVWQAAEILAQLEESPHGPLAAAARVARGAMLRTPVL